MIVLHKKDIEKYLEMDKRLKKALQMIVAGAVDHAPLGRTDEDENMYYNVQSYETKPFEATCYEAHEVWIDIQYIRKGREWIDVKVTEEGLSVKERNPEKDYILFECGADDCTNRICLEEDMLAVFYPEDIHRPCIGACGAQKVEKIVFKIKVQA